MLDTLPVTLPVEVPVVRGEPLSSFVCRSLIAGLWLLQQQTTGTAQYSSSSFPPRFVIHMQYNARQSNATQRNILPVVG